MAASKADRKDSVAAGTATGKKQKAAGSRTRPSASGSKTRGKKTAHRKAGSTSRARTEGLTSEALRIVEQAASILEEEIAAGIVAAKKVEERYVDVNALRSGASEQVIQRFRKDAHEVLDILLDLVNLSFTALTGLGERAMKIRGVVGTKEKPAARTEESLPELVVAEAVKPGESGMLAMLVENDSDQPTGQVAFVAADLLSLSGDRLDAAHVGFEPASLEVAAHGVDKVNITVSVPEGTPPGQYSGLVLAPAVQMRAIFTFLVEA